MPLIDFYEVLGVSPRADQAAIRAAYRRLAKRYHPDFNPGPQAVLRMQEINAAYEVLGDRIKRRSYDAARAVQTVLASEPPPGEVTASPTPAPPWGTVPPQGRARYAPPDLSDREREQLARRSELRRRWPGTGGPTTARCYRCGYLWSPRGAERPGRCPYCRRRDWDRYRVFQCARCGHVWESSALQGAATAVYPACVKCGTLSWHLPTVRRRRHTAAVRRAAWVVARPLRPPALLLWRLIRVLARLAWRALRAVLRVAFGPLLRLPLPRRFPRFHRAGRRTL